LFVRGDVGVGVVVNADMPTCYPPIFVIVLAKKFVFNLVIILTKKFIFNLVIDRISSPVRKDLSVSGDSG
jgi:hypothetical protein